MMSIHDRHHAEGMLETVLEEIRRPDVNLAIWLRSEPPVSAIARFLEGEPVRVDVPRPTAETLRTALGPKSDRGLCADILRLTRIFGRIAGTEHPRVRLERVEDDGCALFHADSLRLRMLCTYAGEGTEWLGNDNVHWNELGLRGRTIEEANAAIVRDFGAVRSLPSRAVAIFSGRGRPETPPLIHRSAPVRANGGVRLRLCIDLPTACAC